MTRLGTLRANHHQPPKRPLRQQCPHLILLLLVPCAAAQTFSQRGFLEFRNEIFPQTQINDSSHLISEALLRWEGLLKLPDDWQINASFDARADTHDQFTRDARLDLLDQDPQRPALSLRRISLTWHRGPITIGLGRQFIRWGKADLINPEDRFAPRDFTNVLQPDYLGVTAARVTYEQGSETLDAVYAPWFTPSRTPLFNERWVPVPNLPDQGSQIPGRGQAGLRWNHLGAGYEFAVCYYDGFNHLPDLVPYVLRVYPRLRFYGGDFAVPTRWFTVKAETGYFQSPQRTTDQYLQYVVQLERTSGEWFFVGGYTNEYVTDVRYSINFNPDRGLAKTFLGRASYNLDANRTVAFEGAIRQNGDGGYAKAEYTQAIGSHWRATASYTLLRGAAADFLGQYRRNSHFLLTLRYSF